MLNKYMAIGNLTQNPSTKEVGEYSVTTFGLAINDVFYKNKEKVKQVTFIDIETWGRQAENCSKYLEKGKRVLIEGKIKMNSWEKDGKKFNKLFCVAEKVTFMGSDSASDSETKGSSPDKKDVKGQEGVESSGYEDTMDDIPF
jgi:single-strand DNA-binding protein